VKAVQGRCSHGLACFAWMRVRPCDRCAWNVMADHSDAGQGRRHTNDPTAARVASLIHVHLKMSPRSGKFVGCQEKVPGSTYIPDGMPRACVFAATRHHVAETTQAGG
jgi:hypothetical protein